MIEAVYRQVKKDYTLVQRDMGDLKELKKQYTEKMYENDHHLNLMDENITVNEWYTIPADESKRFLMQDHFKDY